MQVDEGTQGGAWPVTSPYLDFPALTQAIKGTVAAPNDRAGTQGIGQTSPDTVGMGGQYGQNLIQQKAQDIQKAETFKLPAPPDERPGTSVGTPLVVPYLSHGIGVNAAQFNGSPVRPDDRAGARPSMPTNAPTSFAAPVSTTGDGFDWASAGSARPASRRSRWPSDSSWFLGAAAATRASRSRKGTPETRQGGGPGTARPTSCKRRSTSSVIRSRGARRVLAQALERVMARPPRPIYRSQSITDRITADEETP